MTNRYLVVDLPTVGPQKGLITKIWDVELNFTDAHLLRKKIANRRLSKWPVVLDELGPDAEKPGISPTVVFPTPDQCVMLAIDAVKIGRLKAELATLTVNGSPVQQTWSDEERLAGVHAAAKQATDEANARAERAAAEIKASADVEAAKSDLDGATVTKRDDGSYTAGPPPDGRSVDEHLDDLIRHDYADVTATTKTIAGDHSDVPVSEP